MTYQQAPTSYDVVIIGGGVTGTALLYVLAAYTNIERIALVEKHRRVAQVNSDTRRNSQTLHFGDIETNYSLDEAQRVKEAAGMIVRYVALTTFTKPFLFRYPKMLLGVGARECALLSKRYEQFRHLFPDLRLLDSAEIARVEQEIARGRKRDIPFLALYSEKGYAVDFNALAQSFVADAAHHGGKRVSLFLGERVMRIRQKNDGFTIEGVARWLQATVLVITSGGESLFFARQLGYGKEYAVLPIAGNFYETPPYVRSKVYTVQKESLPFAAVHGDPDVSAPGRNRFGPTGKVIPLLERGDVRTFFEFFAVMPKAPKKLWLVVRLLGDRAILGYLVRNFFYELPLIGKFFFIREIRKIIPTARIRDIHRSKEGGLRPQLVDINNVALLHGEQKIIGSSFICNLTPSPGASVCLKTAQDDAQTIVEFLGGGARFEKDRFWNDFMGDTH